MTDLERARHLFLGAGLSFPSIPAELAAGLKRQGRWLFSTRDLEMSPYNLDHYLRELSKSPVEDYAVLAHSGHGVNSYAVQYYVVRGELRMFLHLAWGGVYGDERTDARQIRECFSLADQIVEATTPGPDVKGGDQLIVVACEFYGSYWAPHGEGGQAEKQVCRLPNEALAAALCWLTR